MSICTTCCQTDEDVFLICWCFFFLHVFSEVAVRWALSATVGLNMNPACSVSLGIYEWRRRSFFNYTNNEAHVNSLWFSAYASHDMNTWTYRESLHDNCTVSFEKTSIISYCIDTNFTAACQTKRAVLHVTEIYYSCFTFVQYNVHVYMFHLLTNLKQINHKKNYNNHSNHLIV